MIRNIIFLFALLLIGCKNNAPQPFIPNVPEGMTEAFYQKYKTKLDTAYANNDQFEIGVQLANLKASSERVFTNINDGLKSNPEYCYRVYDWYNGYTHDFLNNIVKIDTSEFLNSFELCKEFKNIETYSEYRTRKHLEHQERLAKREPIDSTKLNQKLIDLLEVIREDDQNTRIQISKQRIEDYNHPLWIKQNTLDSINLLKVESILENGFPSKDEVGYDKVSTIWLVLHHQGDLETRMKYMPILEKAVAEKKLGSGAMEAYKWRNENIRLNNKDEQ